MRAKVHVTLFCILLYGESNLPVYIPDPLWLKSMFLKNIGSSKTLVSTFLLLVCVILVSRGTKLSCSRIVWYGFLEILNRRLRSLFTSIFSSFFWQSFSFSERSRTLLALFAHLILYSCWTNILLTSEASLLLTS